MSENATNVVNESTVHVHPIKARDAYLNKLLKKDKVVNAIVQTNQIINHIKMCVLPTNSFTDVTEFSHSPPLTLRLAPNASPAAINTIKFPPQFFSGSQLINLYNIPTVAPTTPATKKVKIAIVIAFTYPKLLSDLKTYWQNDINFGAKSNPPIVNIKTMPGATQNAVWAQEECLDVQMVCTMNPNATIWVVEAASNSITDLTAAINYATNIIQVDVVTMSWGTNDTPATLDFNTNFTNTNVCYCASTGDSNVVSWPAVSSNCIAVGGTTLFWTPNATSTRKEYTWLDAGCGYSSTVKQPKYQSGVTTINHIYRAIPDLSMIANNNTAVYTVYNGDWYAVGGTSVSAPIFAAILSLANQIRFNNNKGALTTVYSITPNNTHPSNYKAPANNVQTYIYNKIYPNAVKYAAAFYDVIVGINNGSIGGSSTGTINYNAGNKFDVPTGLGSPNATNLCNQLLNV